jgi:hypothetical protein
MFSGGMDVVLKYHTVPGIINDSLSNRTMKVVNSRFLVMCESARRKMPFIKLGYIYKTFSQVVFKDDGLSGNP